jgi:CRP-like cAMP-binding protein
MNFLLPGDFVGLCGLVGERSDYGVEAVTAVSALTFSSDFMMQVLSRSGDPRDVALWALEQHGSIVMEHLLSVGRRNATERVTHLVLELWLRLRKIENCPTEVFRLPLSLSYWADALGLSEVHMSRTIQALRKTGGVEINVPKKWATILNLDTAVERCAFDPGFLKYD